MPTVTISAELAQAIADYLSTRPYREVAGLIAAMSQAAQASAEAQDKAEPEKAG